MGERGQKRTRPGERPIPLDPIDLLAGLAPGVELEAGGALTTVAETGKLLRADDDTVRRLIRTTAIEPAGGRTRRRRFHARAGALRHSRRRPGE